MAWKTAQFKLTSVCPMLTHNAAMADPLGKWYKAMKQISGKRQKTDADHEEMARLEFLSALYINEQGPVIPQAWIDATLTGAAKKGKEGQLAKSGVFCKSPAMLEYDGPRTPNELWESADFRHRQLVRVGTARIMRTRPVFKSWSALVEVSVEDSIVNPSRLSDWFTIAGQYLGFGDWRPQYGRFESTRIN